MYFVCSRQTDDFVKNMLLNYIIYYNIKCILMILEDHEDGEYSEFERIESIWRVFGIKEIKEDR